jgi:hypothetical protein
METLVGLHAAAVARALEGLAQWFEPRSTRPAILARAALGRPLPDDASFTERNIAQLRAETRMDGSVRGDLVATAWRAIELIDLGHGPDQAGTVRVVGYLLARQDEPGAYGKGIARPEHAGRELSGFFSPGATGEQLAPMIFPTGAVFTEEADARYAASCLALRAALKAHQEKRPQVQAHLASLASLASDWGNAAMPVTLACSTLHGLALSLPPERDALPGLVQRIAKAQQDGAWPDVDLFHALQALLAVPDAAATEVIARAVPVLLSLQAADGGFGGVGSVAEERGWIAVRALVRAGRK